MVCGFNLTDAANKHSTPMNEVVNSSTLLVSVSHPQTNKLCLFSAELSPSALHDSRSTNRGKVSMTDQSVQSVHYSKQNDPETTVILLFP